MAKVRQIGAFRRMAAVQLDDVRVRRAIKGIPYVPRDCEPDVEHGLQQRRVLIVGPPMSGKTRLALQLARDIFPDHGCVDARDGTDLRAMLEVEPDESSLVVWLDDLVRFLGADGLNRNVLDLLYARGNVLIATIGSDSYDDLMADSAVRPAGWGVPAWFGVPIRLGDWSESEFDRAARRGVSEQTLATARHVGLPASVGGGPVLLRRLRAGTTTQPVGCAVVKAAVDWRRTGISAPLSRAVLVELLPAYLGSSPAATDPDAVPNGISWATTRVNGVALLDETESGFDVLDYAVEQLSAEDTPIPEPVWTAALGHARPQDLLNVGYQAASRHGRPDLAMAAYRRAAVSQDPDSAAVAEVALNSLSQQAEADADGATATTEYATSRARGLHGHRGNASRRARESSCELESGCAGPCANHHDAWRHRRSADIGDAEGRCQSRHGSPEASRPRGCNGRVATGPRLRSSGSGPGRRTVHGVGAQPSG